MKQANKSIGLQTIFKIIHSVKYTMLPISNFGHEQVKKNFNSLKLTKTELRQSDARIARPANKGEWYPAEYDKPHDIKLVGNYQITQRYSASLNVDYSTGRPQTMPVSQYYSNTIGATSFVFSERNGVRIPDYFRMDLSFNIKPTHRLNAKAYTFFTIGVYNMTGRKNVYSIYFKNEGEEFHSQNTTYLSHLYGSMP